MTERFESTVIRIASIVLGAALLAPLAAAAPISYDQQIRPLLSDKCFQCHGPDEAARKAKLRLDVADAGPDAPVVLAPGKPEESELFRRITTTNHDDLMPPVETGKPLNSEEIALIRKWIEEGAHRTSHWAFATPERGAVPVASRPEWTRNPIDNFILARLDQEGLAPSPEADRETLLRRLSLDLIGLPPTLEDIAALRADTSPDWYEKQVERLLASPHYGEHWARNWMDAAQYADSDGFEKDKPRQVWTWRDWVIRAMNEDMPYNEFVLEQIAGDMLPDATQPQRVATGFLRNSMVNEEGGIQPEQFRMEAMYNRMDLVGRAVLGLTVACAQCHSHKYDPLTQTEYYQMFAFLNNSHEATASVYSFDDLDQRSRILDVIRDIEAGIKRDLPDWRDRIAAWEEKAKAEPEPAWEVLALAFDDSSAGGQKCLLLEDGSYLAQGYAPTRFWPKMTTTTALTTITAVRLEVIADPNLPRGGPGRSIHGGLALSEMEMRITTGNTPIANYDQWTPVKFASAIASVNPPQRKLGAEFPERDKPEKRVTGPIEMAIDGNGDTAWTTDIDPGRRNQSQYAIFKLETPLVVPAGATLAFRIGQLHGGWNSDDNQTNNIGRFRIAVTGDATLPAEALPLPVKAALADTNRSEEEINTLFNHWRTTVPELAWTNQRIDGLWQGHPLGATQLVLAERDTPRETHRLERGDFLSPAETVQPAVPAFLHPLKSDGTPDRLDFAKWLVAPESPTTARAAVNRVWARHFGEGIVSTTADLGMAGDPPSHRELLDWLAVEFMEGGWKLKDLHRLIVHSATYRQASNVSPELLERDPYNRLLARGARFRVEGETVRDIALAASGLLNERIGGPSVYPPAPEFLFVPPASYGPKTWNTDTGPDAYRRALYTFRFRSVPYPALQVFDAPAGDAPCTARERSNSPLQALTVLNEPVYYESAVHLAERTLAEAPADDRARIAQAFQRCTSREASPEELDALAAFLQEQRNRIGNGELDPAAILAPLSGKVNGDANDLAAWALTARVILNLDETIIRQ
ncbi:MAG: PSD1 domain-containing protein [Candidatus Hydrogenedentes bacterium]|nr:PSD1 domain-containing protein [Candidatus Hydrogenedentota bacterium]